ncbi:MAG: dockerin type I domain-containing protein [Gemmatimonadetes bacterium]|nr:dockerin type I domain-containing protein [Gemmatimonadota bacterium]
MYKNLTIVGLIGLFFAGPVSANSHTDPDFNDDGIVNSSDYALFLSHWGEQTDDPNWDAKFDLNSDGIINSTDYALFLANWGKTFPVTPQNARDVLVALYNATGGTNWTTKTNWLSNNDISTWHGVSVSNGKVTGLDLSLNNLMGTIPAALGNLNNLENLNLTGNQLNGAIPTALGNLNNLENLNLSFNQLSGEIPATLGNLSNLEVMWLVSNQLSGALPATLGNLSNLEVVILNINQLSGELPQSLTRLTNLMTFSFGNNRGLCAPSGIQTWLQGIADAAGPNCE